MVTSVKDSCVVYAVQSFHDGVECKSLCVCSWKWMYTCTCVYGGQRSTWGVFLDCESLLELTGSGEQPNELQGSTNLCPQLKHWG